MIISNMDQRAWSVLTKAIYIYQAMTLTKDSVHVKMAGTRTPTCPYTGMV
jgi:hypothetical protein